MFTNSLDFDLTFAPTYAELFPGISFAEDSQTLSSSADTSPECSEMQTALDFDLSLELDGQYEMTPPGTPPLVEDGSVSAIDPCLLWPEHVHKSLNSLVPRSPVFGASASSGDLTALAQQSAQNQHQSHQHQSHQHQHQHQYQHVPQPLHHSHSVPSLPTMSSTANGASVSTPKAGVMSANMMGAGPSATRPSGVHRPTPMHSANGASAASGVVRAPGAHPHTHAHGEDDAEREQHRATRKCAGCGLEKKRVYRYLSASEPFCNACNQHWRRHIHECVICTKLRAIGANPELRGADILLYQGPNKSRAKKEGRRMLKGAGAMPSTVSAPMTPSSMHSNGSSSMMASRPQMKTPYGVSPRRQTIHHMQQHMQHPQQSQQQPQGSMGRTDEMSMATPRAPCVVDGPLM